MRETNRDDAYGDTGTVISYSPRACGECWPAEVTGAKKVTVNGVSSPARALEPRRCRCLVGVVLLAPNSGQSRKARPPGLCSTLVARAAVAPARLTPHSFPSASPGSLNSRGAPSPAARRPPLSPPPPPARNLSALQPACPSREARRVVPEGGGSVQRGRAPAHPPAHSPY